MLRSGASSLIADLDVEATPDAPIGAMTWYGIGGRADLLVRPRTVEALETLARRALLSQTPLRVLGSGANLLIGDDGVDGIVVRLDQPAFRDIRYNREGEESRLRAMAGADLARTLMDAARRGLEGLSQMAGIPATIGGAIRMNAGGAFGAIGDAVESVTCITEGGERVAYARSEIDFGYRTTNIPERIIVSATFRLVPDDPLAVRARVKKIFEFKKSTQPLAEHSAGCTFRNPFDPVIEERVPAGRLIDEAGLKGLRSGGASVSTRHANFVVCEPGATARDVLDLIEEIRKRVFDSSGLMLEEEIAVWRRDL